MKDMEFRITMIVINNSFIQRCYYLSTFIILKTRITIQLFPPHSESPIARTISSDMTTLSRQLVGLLRFVTYTFYPTNRSQPSNWLNQSSLSMRSADAR